MSHSITSLLLRREFYHLDEERRRQKPEQPCDEPICPARATPRLICYAESTVKSKVREYDLLLPKLPEQKFFKFKISRIPDLNLSLPS